MTAPFITELCPKCDQAANLTIHGWYPIIDEFGDSGTVHFAVHCNRCFSYTGGTLYHDPTGPVMNQTLSMYANEKNDVTGLFKDKGINFIFDYKDRPYQNPLILELLNSKNKNAATIVEILRQAYTCMSQKCWDAVGILCRKIIDIETSALWQLKFPKGILPFSLYKRIKDIYPSENNSIHHMAHVIRLEGNGAAHSNVLFTHDNAKLILTFTEGLLKKNGMNNEKFS